MTFNERLKKAREYRGLTQDKLAELVGLTQPAINKLENDPTRRTKNILKFAKVLNVNPLWLEDNSGPAPWEIEDSLPVGQIPLLTADELIKLQINAIAPSKPNFIKAPFAIQDRNLFAYTVEDEAMFSATARPKPFVPGEIIIVERGTIPFTGELVVAINNGQVLFRKLLKDGTHLVLMPENAMYPRVEYTDDPKLPKVIICGVVVGSVFESKK